MTLRRILPLATLLLLTPFLQPPALADPADLAVNGGFERDDDLNLFPDGWAPRAAPDTLARASPLAPHEGLWALELGDLLESTPGGVVSDPIPVTPGQQLVFTAWTMLVASQPTVFIVEAPHTTMGVDFGLGDAAPDLTFGIPQTTGWTRLQAPVLVPYGVTSLRLAFDTRGPALLRVDGVSLTPAPHDGNLLPNPGFEAGHYRKMPDLWAIPCGIQRGIWLGPITEGAHSLYFQMAAWPTCDRAVSVPFVLEPGAYEVGGDQYLIGKGVGTLEVVVHDAATSHAAGDAPLVHASLDVRARGVYRETLAFCAPEGSAQAVVVLMAPPGLTPAFWDAMRLVRTGPCP